MDYLTKDKFLSLKWFKAYALILVGSFILAAGFVFFIDPHRIVPGGVFGIGIMVNHLTRGLLEWAPHGFPIGLTGLLLNIPLTLIGIRLLGPRFGIKTVVGFFLSAMFIDGLHFLVGYEALVDDVLLSCIFGGLLVGVGLGLIFRSRATSGGSDIIAMILAKYTRLPVGQLIIYVDSVIVLLALAAFGDWKIPLYSWIVIFVTGRVVDVTLQGVAYNKALFIVSDRYEQIRAQLLAMDRSGTLILGTGMYEGRERRVIFTNVSRREAHILVDFIRGEDPHAFITIIDAAEVLGLGFKPLREE